MTSSSRSEACPEDRPSSKTGIAVCIRGPELWKEPSLTDISDSRSAESQSVVSGDSVKFLESRLCCPFCFGGGTTRILKMNCIFDTYWFYNESKQTADLVNN